MALVDIKYSCGCGWNTKNPVDAVNHVDKTGHTITIFGTVKKEKPVKPDYIPRDYTTPVNKLSDLKKSIGQ